MSKSCDENSLVAKYMLDDDLGQECKVIPEEDWITTHTHQYQGFWIATMILQGFILSKELSSP